MTRPTRAGLAAAASAAILTLGLAGPAPAALIQKDGETIRITAAPGEDNSLYVHRWEGTFQAHDYVPLIAGPGCISDGSYARCPGPVDRVEATLGDMDDSFQFGNDVPYAGVHLEVDAGAGEDGVSNHAAPTSRLYGGEDQDHLYGGPGADVVEGGPGPWDNLYGYGGADHLIAGPDPSTLYGGDGDDLLDGGPGMDYLIGADWLDRHGIESDTLNGNGGDDLLDGQLGNDTVNGGEGDDVVDYNYHDADVTVTLDGEPGDGAEGENDAVAGDVEGIRGGSGDDTLVGNESPNRISGMLGDDDMLGHGGADWISGSSGADLLEAGGGADFLRGGLGNDELAGGEGTDEFEAQEGDDAIDARDADAASGAELIDCGVGNDSARADSAELPADCETVEYPDRTVVTPDSGVGPGPWQPAEALVTGVETADRGVAHEVTTQGETVVAWNVAAPLGEPKHIRWGVKRPGQPLEVHDLDTPDHVSIAGLVADSLGNTFLAWLEPGNKLKVAVRPAGGSFGAPQSFDMRGSWLALVANNRGDVALVAFDDHRWVASLRPPDGSFGEFVPVSDAIEGWPDERRAVLTDAGEVMVAFTEDDGSAPFLLRVASRGEDGVVRPVQQVNTGLRMAGDLDLGVDALGRAALTWNESEARYYEDTVNRVWDTNMIALRHPGTGLFDPPTVVPGAETGANGARLAVSGAGLVTVAYEIGDEGRVYSAPFGAPLERIRTFELSQLFTVPSMATSPGGELVIGWGAGIEHWVTSFRSGSGRFGRVEDVRPGCDHAMYVDLEINDAGQAAALVLEPRNGDWFDWEPMIAVTGDRAAQGRQECVEGGEVYAEDVPPGPEEEPPIEVDPPVELPDTPVDESPAPRETPPGEDAPRDGDAPRGDGPPSAGPPIGPAGGPPPAAVAPVRIGAVKLKGKGLKRTVRAPLGCERPGRATATLLLETARRHALVRMKRRVTCKQAGELVLGVRLSRAGLRRLRREAPARLVLKTTARGADGRLHAASAQLWLRR